MLNDAVQQHFAPAPMVQELPIPVSSVPYDQTVITDEAGSICFISSQNNTFLSPSFGCTIGS